MRSLFNAPSPQRQKDIPMITRTHRPTLLAAHLLLWAALAGAAASAGAQGVPPTAAPAARLMGMQQVIDHVATLGFRDVQEVERKSDKLYEVKAWDAQGRLVELYVDARSGDILKQELKDRRRKD